GRPPGRLERAAAPRRPRARASLRDSFRDFGPAVHALASDAPRGAGRRGGRPQAPLPLAEDQQALVQAPLLHAGSLSHLFPRGGPGDGELPAEPPPADRPGTARDDPPPRRDHGGALLDRRLRRARARVPRAVLPGLPGRLRPE